MRTRATIARQPLPRNKQSSDHGEGDDDEHGRAIKLTAQQLSEFGIEVGSAGPGPLDVAIELQTEITFNEDRLPHVTPRVPGIVTRVDKTLGDPVRAGDTLAVMQSRVPATGAGAGSTLKVRVATPGSFISAVSSRGC